MAIYTNTRMREIERERTKKSEKVSVQSKEEVKIAKFKIQNIEILTEMTWLLSNLTVNFYYNNSNLDRKCYDSVLETLRKIDFLKLSQDEAEILGFRKWQKESNLYLIPIWLYDAIPNGMELISFDGEKVIKGKDYIDMDIRFGLLAYGINLAPETIEVVPSSPEEDLINDIRQE